MQTSQRKLLAKLLAMAVAMFLFAVFVLPQLYDLFCEITGIGGRTDGKYEAVEVRVDTSRQVEVQFVATNNAEMLGILPNRIQCCYSPGESKAIFRSQYHP